jgi:thymidylate synthase
VGWTLAGMSASTAHFLGLCLDDLMRDAVEAIIDQGQHVTARRGSFTELIGVMLHLQDPRARLSRTQTRGRPFSALGEFCWYMGGCDDLPSIEYYIPEYRNEAIEGMLPGAYGPRLVGARDHDQLGRTIALLKEHQTSRKAVIRLFDAQDLRTGQRDVPCTCTLQYFTRAGRLDAVTYMRSNDVYLGLPHDVFCFTLLQEYVARRLGVKLGSYKHIVGSLHLYDEHKQGALRFLREGFQSTEYPMPAMPVTDPEGSLSALLQAEAELRESCVNSRNVDALIAAVDSFWGDLIRLLRVFRLSKNEAAPENVRVDHILDVKCQMASDIYNPFIDRLVERLQNA